MFLSDIAEFRNATLAKRLLGLDIGEKTIGMALSDTRKVIASPLDTIQRKKFTKDAESLIAVIHLHEVGGLVVGFPLHLDGGQGKTTQAVKQFAQNLLKIKDIPIFFQDERLSTVAVTNAMLEADLSRKKRDKYVDKLAASYILQNFIDRMNNVQ